MWRKMTLLSQMQMFKKLKPNAFVDLTLNIGGSTFNTKHWAFYIGRARCHALPVQ